MVKITIQKMFHLINSGFKGSISFYGKIVFNPRSKDNDLLKEVRDFELHNLADDTYVLGYCGSVVGSLPFVKDGEFRLNEEYIGLIVREDPCIELEVIFPHEHDGRDQILMSIIAPYNIEYKP